MIDDKQEQFIRKWSQVIPRGVPLRPGNRVDYLVDGWATFQAMYEAICYTFEKNSAFYIYLLGWWLDDDFQLVPKDPESTISKLFRKASLDYEVQIRIMLWNNYLMWPLNPKTQERQKNEFNKLPTGACILDIFLPTFWQSHHQKILITKGARGVIAFCGGLDIAKDRVGKVTFHPGSPFHDVHCRIQGNGACDLIDVFVQRWLSHPDSKSLDDTKGHLRGMIDRTPPSKDRKPAGDQFVAIARTFNSFKVKKEWCAKDLSIRETLIRAIGAARRFIYIEDQYLVDKELAEALLDALKHIQHLTILIPYESDLPLIEGGRSVFVWKIWSDKSTAKNARVFQLNKETYVHAKTWIFDDEFAVIGSANCNRRGLVGDSEVMANIFDKPASDEAPSFPQKLRRHLWREHLGVDVPDGTSAEPWVKAAQARKVITYIPELLPKEADQFPSPTKLANLKAQVASYFSTYSASLTSPVTEKEAWDQVLDPLPEPLQSCQKGK